jgi:chromosome segregation ATPase
MHIPPATQLRDMAVELTATRSCASRAEEEVARLKMLHAQVKGALEGAYGQNQELSKQIQELERLCAAQQNSLEEGEERYRKLADGHDALRHAGLQAKAQLVTAQAQVGELRAARDDLAGEVARLEGRAAAARAEVDAKDAR